VAQSLSFSCGGTGLAAGPWPLPVTKSTVSWHELQVFRVGRVYQTSFSTALVSWQVVQS